MLVLVYEIQRSGQCQIDRPKCIPPQDSTTFWMNRLLW